VSWFELQCAYGSALSPISVVHLAEAVFAGDGGLPELDDQSGRTIDMTLPKPSWRGPYKRRQGPLPRGIEMSRQVIVVLYVAAMVAVIVGVDFVFLRNRFWERLIVNIGIVLVFGAFYFRFLRHL
jgi:hypothetical protein